MGRTRLASADSRFSRQGAYHLIVLTAIHEPRSTELHAFLRSARRVFRPPGIGARQLARLDRRHRALGYAKLSVGVATLMVAVWLLKYHPQYIAFFLVPAAGYVVLAILHERVIRARRRYSRDHGVL